MDSWRQRLATFLYDISVDLFSSTIVRWGVPLLYFALTVSGTVVLYHFRAECTAWIVFSTFLVLTCTGALGLFTWYFATSRKHRLLRLTGLTRALSVFRYEVDSVAASTLDHIVVPPIEADLTALLQSLRNTMISRQNSETKGVMVFYFDAEEKDQDKQLKFLAESGHDKNAVAATQTLPRDSLAYDAVKYEKTVYMADSRKPPRVFPGYGQLHWHENQNNSRFRSRTATPIRIPGPEGNITVGVLCFDYTSPRVITEEDERILQLVAEAIAAKWLEFQLN